MGLKDYLHYYKGCNVITTDDNEQAELVGVTDDDAHLVHAGTGSYGTCDISGVKPQLRRLEDMTEEEALKCADILNFGMTASDSAKVTQVKSLLGTNRFYNSVTTITGADWVNLFKYLLTRGFDLFGLIDAGLAIDIKTLTP